MEVFVVTVYIGGEVLTGTEHNDEREAIREAIRVRRKLQARYGKESVSVSVGIFDSKPQWWIVDGVAFRYEDAATAYAKELKWEGEIVNTCER